MGQQEVANQSVNQRSTGGGGGGAYSIMVINVTPGDEFAFSAGTGGTAGTGNQAAGGAGANGIIEILYTVVVCPTITAHVDSKTDLNCFDTSDGTVPISVSGGASPYNFSDNDGTSYVSGNNLPSAGKHTFSGLSANEVYKIRVKDASGCESPIVQ